MGKTKNALLLATIAAGAAYFSKPENREKAQVAFQNMKIKADSFIASQKRAMNEEETNLGNPDPYDLEDTEMMSEGGGQTSLNYYNKEKEE